MKFQDEGPFLRSERLKKGLLIKDLSDKTGLYEQQISNIENGFVGLPNKHIVKVCVALGLPVSKFVDKRVEWYKKEITKYVKRNT